MTQLTRIATVAINAGLRRSKVDGAEVVLVAGEQR